MAGQPTPSRARPSSAGPLVPRPNSFNFAPVRDVARRRGAPCPLRDAGEPMAPARNLFVRLRHGMRLFATTTEDFSDEELHEIKELRGQIYVDVSTKLAPDDFERDLTKLLLDPECATCARRGQCGGCWLPARENVFTADRKHLEDLLGTLTGSILDIGCGDAPYVQAIATRVRAGLVTYLGVDPDAERVGLLCSRHPWADYRVGDPSVLLSGGGPAPRFQHVMLLRSYNHLPDPLRTLELAVSLLEPGGTLLVADNVTFGLVRSQGQVDRAQRGPSRFEHFRNDDQDRAARVIARPELRLLERRDISPSRSNEWLLHYEKIGTSHDDRRA